MPNKLQNSRLSCTQADTDARTKAGIIPGRIPPRLIFYFCLIRFAARYFNDAPPVFQRLFFTSEESSAVQYGPRRMKLRDLMGATLRFLQSDCAKFRILWDWSPCVSQLLTSDIMVRGYVPASLLDPKQVLWAIRITNH